MVDLRWTADEKGDHNATGLALRNVGWQPHKTVYQSCSIIRIADTDYDSYFAARSKKWRHELRRQSRALERNYEVSFLRHRPGGAAYGDDDPRWDIYEDCLRISQQSWQGGSTTGNTLCHDHVRPFLRDCHAVAARLGMLDIAVLKLDDSPVAFQYDYHLHGSVQGLRMGFDREFSKQGVGKVLMNRLIKDSFQRGDKMLDMGIGDFQFKRRFRTDVETSYRFACYPWSSWRSQGVRLSRWLKGRSAEKRLATAAKATSL